MSTEANSAGDQSYNDDAGHFHWLSQEQGGRDFAWSAAFDCNLLQLCWAGDRASFSHIPLLIDSHLNNNHAVDTGRPGLEGYSGFAG